MTAQTDTAIVASMPLSQLPVGKRRPNPGEFQVIWQVYLYQTDEKLAARAAAAWLKGSRSNILFQVLDEEDRGVLVDYPGVYDWRLEERPNNPGEVQAYWDVYVEADSFADAARRAFEIIDGTDELKISIVG